MQPHIVTIQTSQATLDSIAPRFAVGNLAQALAFYEQLGFATTYQDEGFAIVERDGIDVHLNPSKELPTQSVQEPFNYQVYSHVTSINRDMHKQELADENLRCVGLRQSVDLLYGDATEIVANVTDLFDCVFFDADRLSASAQLKLLLPKLTSDALVLADNALSHPEEIAEYLKTLEELSFFEHLIVPVGKGLSVAYKE